MDRKAGGILACVLLVLLTAISVAASPMFIATARNLRGALFVGYGPSPYHASEMAMAKCSQHSWLPFKCRVLGVRMEYPPPPPPWALQPPPSARQKSYHPKKSSTRYRNAPIRSHNSYRSYSTRSKVRSSKSSRQEDTSRVNSSKSSRDDNKPKVYSSRARQEKESLKPYSGRSGSRLDKPREYSRKSDLYLNGSKSSSEGKAKGGSGSSGTTSSSQGNISQRFQWGRPE